MADSPLKLGNLGQQPAVSADQSKIGDLRRRYNFGSAVSELAIDQTPFFRFLSQVAVDPTDDSEFKTTEERSMWHKRYGYVVGVDQDGDGTATNFADDKALIDAELQVGDTFTIKVGTDYKAEGNVQSILGRTPIAVGATGTAPIFMMEGQLMKIPLYKATLEADAQISEADGDYIVVRLGAVTISGEYAYALATVKRGSSAGYIYLANSLSNANANGVASVTLDAGFTEANKCYVVGSAHAEGSGFPGTFKDSPYLVRTGYTQIFKTTCQMTNTARATQLKFAQDEWARVWKNKLIEHKYDIETALLFGAGSYDSVNRIGYSAGIVDYVLNNGNVFSWSTSKSSDDFLQDMSDFMDPRYNNASSTLFMVSTEVYNWLHKLGGYLSANMAALNSGTGANSAKADFAITGKSVKYGLNVTTISTPYGDMNCVRNIHLDGGQGGASIVGVNMKHVKYRPLVGNGVNRDTSIFVGVQSLENTGVDRRIDLIQTEAGLQCIMPEAHAVWK